MGEVDLVTIGSEISSSIVIVLDWRKNFFLFGISKGLLFSQTLEIVVDIWKTIICTFSWLAYLRRPVWEGLGRGRAYNSGCDTCERY